MIPFSQSLHRTILDVKSSYCIMAFRTFLKVRKSLKKMNAMRIY